MGTTVGSHAHTAGMHEERVIDLPHKSLLSMPTHNDRRRRQFTLPLKERRIDPGTQGIGRARQGTVADLYQDPVHGQGQPGWQRSEVFQVQARTELVGPFQGLEIDLWQSLPEGVMLPAEAGEPAVALTLNAGDGLAAQDLDHFMGSRVVHYAISSVYNGLNTFVHDQIQDALQGTHIASNVANRHEDHLSHPPKERPIAPTVGLSRAWVSPAQAGAVPALSGPIFILAVKIALDKSF